MLRRLVLAAVLVGLSVPETASAGTCTSGGGNWDDPGAWSGADCPTIPGTDDDAVITGGVINVNTADGTANSVDLRSGATLSVWDAHTLAIDGGATSTFAGTVEVLDAGSILQLAGNTTWSAGTWGAGGERGGTTPNDPGGRIENAGTLAMPSAVTASNFGGGRIVNLATGSVSSGETSTLVVPFENDGLVTIGAGTLTLSVGSGGGSDGDYAISNAAATLTLGGNHAISLTGGITGPGTLRLAPNVVTLAPDAAYSPAETVFAGGQLDLGGAGTTGEISSASPGGGRRGAGTLTIGPGASSLAGIFFAEGGTTTFAPGGTIAATGSLEVLDAGTVVRLDGTTTWSAGTWSIGGERFITNQPGGAVQNAGVLNITGDTTAANTGSGALANLAGGVWNRTTSAGTATLFPPLANAGSLNVTTGTLNAAVTQSAGTTTVTGTLGAITANGGVVTGGGTITGLLNNAGGTVRPGSSPGTLSVGSFTQGAGGTLDVELDGTAPGSGFDVLDVTGTANLNGTVAVDRTFEPGTSDVFAFLTAGTVNGTFATLTGGTLAGGASLQLDYTGSSARLVVDVPVAPGPGQPAISGNALPGQTLTCQPGTWTGSNIVFAFQWLRDGAAIPGADDQTYTVAGADEGRALSCRVTGSNAGGSATATSPQVPVPITEPPPRPSPTPTPTATPTATPARKPPPATAAEQRLDRATPNQVAAAFGLPSARRCVSRRNFVIRLRRPRGVRIASAQVRVNNKRVRVRRVRGRFTARVDLRGFPKGRFTVKIRIRTTSERTLDGRRRYRTCASRR